MMQPIQIDFELEDFKSDDWFWAQLMGSEPPKIGPNRWIYEWVEVFPTCLGDSTESWFMRDGEHARSGTAYNTLEWANEDQGVMGSGDWVPIRRDQDALGNCPSVMPALQPLGNGAVVRMTQFRIADSNMFFFSSPNNVSGMCSPYPVLKLEEIPSTEGDDPSDNSNGNGVDPDGNNIV